MSDNTNEVLDSEGNPVLDPKIRDHMRAQEKENAALKKQLQTFAVGNACDELGIPKTGAGKLFRDTYSGDATLEAVKTAASGYEGIIPGAQKSPEELALEAKMQADLEALRRVNNSSDQSSTKDASEVLDEVLAKLKATKNVEEFDAIMASPEVQALRNQPITFG